MISRPRRKQFSISMMSAIAAILFLNVQSPANGATLSSSSVVILTSSSTSVKLTSLSGKATISISRSAPFTSSISQSGTKATISIRTKSSTGSGTLTIKDKAGTYTVSVTVRNKMKVSPESLSIAAGESATFLISNASNLDAVTFTYDSTYFSVSRTNSTVTVTGVSAVTESTLTVSDGLTTTKVKVSVSGPQITFLSAKVLASNCFQCHGTNGSGGFERINNESAAEIYEELKELSLEKDSNDIMAAHAKGLSDAQMRAIANYIDSLG